MKQKVKISVAKGRVWHVSITSFNFFSQVFSGAFAEQGASKPMGPTFLWCENWLPRLNRKIIANFFGILQMILSTTYSKNAELVLIVVVDINPLLANHITSTGRYQYIIHGSLTSHPDQF